MPTALRPVRARADRRRPAAADRTRRARSTAAASSPPAFWRWVRKPLAQQDKDKMSTTSYDEQIDVTVEGVPGADGRLRALPRSQVRSDPHARTTTRWSSIFASTRRFRGPRDARLEAALSRRWCPRSCTTISRSAATKIDLQAASISTRRWPNDRRSTTSDVNAAAGRLHGRGARDRACERTAAARHAGCRKQARRGVAGEMGGVSEARPAQCANIWRNGTKRSRAMAAGRREYQERVRRSSLHGLDRQPERVARARPRIGQRPRDAGEAADVQPRDRSRSVTTCSMARTGRSRLQREGRGSGSAARGARRSRALRAELKHLEETAPPEPPHGLRGARRRARRADRSSSAATTTARATPRRSASRRSSPASDQAPIESGSGRLELANWLAQPDQSADRARDGQPHLAVAFRRGHRAHAQTTSARWASGRRIPSCSTTWRSASSRAAGR